MRFFRSRPQELQEPRHLICILNNDGFRVYAPNNNYRVGTIKGGPGGVEIDGRKPTATEIKRGWMVLGS